MRKVIRNTFIYMLLSVMIVTSINWSYFAYAEDEEIVREEVTGIEEGEEEALDVATEEVSCNETTPEIAEESELGIDEIENEIEKQDLEETPEEISEEATEEMPDTFSQEFIFVEDNENKYKVTIESDEALDIEVNLIKKLEKEEIDGFIYTPIFGFDIEKEDKAIEVTVKIETEEDFKDWGENITLLSFDEEKKGIEYEIEDNIITFNSSLLDFVFYDKQEIEPIKQDKEDDIERELIEDKTVKEETTDISEEDAGAKDVNAQESQPQEESEKDDTAKKQDEEKVIESTTKEETDTNKEDIIIEEVYEGLETISKSPKKAYTGPTYGYQTREIQGQGYSYPENNDTTTVWAWLKYEYEYFASTSSGVRGINYKATPGLGQHSLSALPYQLCVSSTIYMDNNKIAETPREYLYTMSSGPTHAVYGNNYAQDQYVFDETDAGAHQLKMVAVLWQRNGTSGNYTYIKRSTVNLIVNIPAPPSYTISFNANGGTGAPAAITKEWYQSGLTIPTKKPTRTGYTFLEWENINSSHDWRHTNPGDEIPMQINENVTFRAVWRINYYNINIYWNDGTSEKIFDYRDEYNSVYSLSNFNVRRHGYKLTGFNTKADGTGTAYGLNSNVTLTSNINLYAQWSPYEMVIRYHANSGTIQDAPHYNSSNSNYYKLSSSIVVSSKSPSSGFTEVTHVRQYGGAAINLVNYSTFNLTRAGYIRTDGTEWRTTSTGGKSFDQDVDYEMTEFGDISQNSQLITLYANWTPITYKIAFNKNKPEVAQNNVAGTMTDQTGLKYGTSYNLKENTYTLKGWTFKGWNTKADGTGTSYANKASVKNLTSTDNGTVTLYAQWQPLQWAVKYHANGGTLTTGTGTTRYRISNSIVQKSTDSGSTWADLKINPQNVDSTAQVNLHNIVTGTGTYDGGVKKTGYHVEGVRAFNTKADGSGLDINQETSDTVNPPTPYRVNGGANITTAKTITLYVNWIPNKYTINFDANKPSNAQNNVTGSTASMTNLDYGVNHTLRANGFSLLGWTFKGWNTAADGSGTSYSDQASVKNLTSTNNGSVTLYAQWEVNKVTIRYHANGASMTPGSGTNSYCRLNGNIVQNSTDSGATWNNLTATVWADRVSNINLHDVMYAYYGDMNKPGYHIKSGAQFNTKADGTGVDINKDTATLSQINGGTQPNEAKTITLYVNWEPDSYTATFVPNGGTWASGTGNKTKSYTIEDILTAPTTITRQGYTFAGWKVTTAGGNWTSNHVYLNSTQTRLEGATGKYGNVTFTAQWTQTGMITVEKETVDNKTGSFTFYIKAWTGTTNKTYFDFSSQGGTLTSNGTYRFTLSNNGSKTFTNIPPGYSYEVWEDSKTGWSLISVDGVSNEDRGEGTLSGNNLAVVHTFLNGKNDSNLTITKNVTGNMGDKSKEYRFTIKFTKMLMAIPSTGGGDPYEEEMPYPLGQDIDLEALGLEPVNSGNKSIYTFTLTHGETLTLPNLPAKIICEIIEDDYSGDGYTTYVDEEEGRSFKQEITENTLVEFINEREQLVPTRVPGDYTSNIGLVLIIVSLVLLILKIKLKKVREG